MVVVSLIFKLEVLYCALNTSSLYAYRPTYIYIYI